ncbi:MAG: hypothetical protein GYB65_01375 [Chloroflexi bacterium]|nr:hypothetical protein [Chloroflexota bacterium]
MASESQPAPTLTCRKCKHVNPGWRSTCERCQSRLPRPEDNPPPRPYRVHRPGCVTGFVILFGAYVLFTGISFAGATAARAGFSPVDVLLLLGLGTLMVVTVVSLTALWRMEKWSRYPVIGLQVVLMVLVVAQTVVALNDDSDDSTATASGPARTGPPPVEEEDAAPDGDEDDEDVDPEAFSEGADVFGAAFFVAVNGVYIYWFVTNRDAFRRPDLDDVEDDDEDTADDPDASV